MNLLLSGSGGGQTSLGMEVVQTSALILIKEHIEEELRRHQEAWDTPDRTIAEALGYEYRPTTLEMPAKFYSGVRLGILGLPFDCFPAVTTMVDRATKKPESDSYDYGSSYGLSLWVEVIVRSDPFYTDQEDTVIERVFEEGNVDRRAKRTADAIVQCLQRDPSLGATTELADPNVFQGESFLLKSSEPGDQTKERVFSLVRAEYVFPTNPSHRDSSTPPPDVLLRGFGQ